MLRTIECFKPGRHTAMSGESLNFTPSTLAAIVNAYDPKVHEAPLVVGHPKDTSPAFGWVKGLRLNKRGHIEAQAGQIAPAFGEAVRTGAYKKVSISLYKPNDPSNPKPGQYYLRHVGFLGGTAPAVKGLEQFDFSDNPANVVTVDFATAEFGGKLRSALEKLRAMVGGLTEQPAEAAALDAELEALATEAEAEAAATEQVAEEVAEETVSEVAQALPDDLAPETVAAIEAIVADAIATGIAAASAGTADHGEHVRIGASVRRPVARKPAPVNAELAKREAAVAQREKEQRRNEHASFLESIVQQGRPLPERAPVLIGLLEALDTVRADAADFGEAETRPPVDVFKALLGRIKKQVIFEEITGGADFADGGRSPSDIAAAAQAYQADQAAKGITVSTSQAVRHVEKG